MNVLISKLYHIWTLKRRYKVTVATTHEELPAMSSQSTEFNCPNSHRTPQHQLCPSPSETQVTVDGISGYLALGLAAAVYLIVGRGRSGYRPF